MRGVGAVLPAARLLLCRQSVRVEERPATVRLSCLCTTSYGTQVVYTQIQLYYVLVICSS